MGWRQRGASGRAKPRQRLDDQHFSSLGSLATRDPYVLRVRLVKDRAPERQLKDRLFGATVRLGDRSTFNAPWRVV